MTPPALYDSLIGTDVPTPCVFTQHRIDENYNSTRRSPSTRSSFSEHEASISPSRQYFYPARYHPTVTTTKVVSPPTHEFEYKIGPTEELGPSEKFLNEYHQKAVETEKAKMFYRERISGLTIDARHENILWNKTSEREFWAFLNSLGFFRRGTLFLLDNGNLRAVWKNEVGDQIGLQFLGNNTIQYVMFTHRPHAATVSRVYGRDTLDGIRRQIAALDLSHLIST